MYSTGSHTRASAVRPLLALALCSFVMGMAEFVIMGILPNIAADLSVSISNTGLLITGYSLGVALSAPVVVLMTSKLSRRRLLIALLAIFVIGNLLASISSDFTILMIARIVSALPHGAFFGIAAVIASGLVAPDRRAGAVAMIISGASIANIVGVPLGTFLGQSFGWRSTFAAITIISIIALILIATMIPKDANNGSASVRREIGAMLKPQAIVALLVSATSFGGVSVVFTYITPILEQITSFSAQSVAWILVLFGVGVTLGNYIGGRLADWRLAGSMMVITGCLAVSQLLLFVTSHNKITAVADVFLLGVFSFGMFPCLTINIMNKSKEALNLASTMNVSAIHISNATGAWLGGLIIDSRFGLSHLPIFASMITMGGLALMTLGLALDRRFMQGESVDESNLSKIDARS